MAELEDRIRGLSLAKRHADAIALARQQLQSSPGNAHFQFTLARVLAESGEKTEALIHAEKAASLQLDSALYAHYAGWLYDEFNLHEYALPLLKRAFLIEPTSSPIICALGKCYDSIGKSDVACTYYMGALECEKNPAKKTAIRFVLARAFVTSNQISKAMEIYENIAASKTEAADRARIELGLLSREGANSQLGRQIAKIVNGSQQNTPQKELGLMALGNLYNNDKQYDQAFGCWKASRDSVNLRVATKREYGGEFESARKVYQAALFDETASQDDLSQSLIVVCGMPRSGTTLTEQIIAAHSNVAGTGELARWHFLDSEFIRRHASDKTLQSIQNAIVSGEMKQRGEEILRILRLVADDSTATHIVEKTPHSFANLGYIKLCLPNTRFLHMQRNPLDTFVSTYQNAFTVGHRYAFDQVEYAKEFMWKERMMALWQGLFPQSILTVNYDSLARGPENTAKDILKFVGLDWEDQCLQFYKGSKTVKTFSTTQIRNPVYGSSVGRWKNYRKHLGPIMSYFDKVGFDYENA